MDWRPWLERLVAGLLSLQGFLLHLWVTSGLEEASERLRRHPLFAPMTLGGLLLLAFLTCGISTDEAISRSFRLVNLSAYERSHAWWAMPLAYVVLLGLCFSRKGRWYRGRLMFGIVILLVAIRFHRGLVGHSSLGYLALRESSDLFGYLLLAVVLWLYGRSFPSGAALILALGLGGILLSRWSIGDDRSLLRPDLFPLLYSLPLAVSAAIDARSNFAGGGTRPTPDPRLGLQYMGLMGGALIGGILQHIESYREGATQTMDALGGLWAESVLMGHGFAPLMRLLRVYTEPAMIAEPRWMGWTGMLASGGIALLLILGFVSTWLTWREIHGRVEHRAAALGAQFSIGLIVVGGPNSMLPLLILFVWTALAVSVPPVPVRPRRPAPAAAGNLEYVRRGALAILLLILAFDCLGFRRPFTASRILNQISGLIEKTPQAERQVEKAARLNPENPLPHLIRAAWQREMLTQSRGWDESLYRSICREYEAAILLDPYEPTIPLRLAEVQGIAKRTEAALETMEEALRRTPGAVDLMSWVYFHATSNNRMDSAKAMIDRRLMLEPEAPHWWRDRFQFEQDAGRASRARVALNVALTGVIGKGNVAEKELVRIAFARAERMR